MKENGIVIKYIEKIRFERKIRVKDLTEGIIAQRTYSRYVAENQDLPLDIITKFLNRLNIPVFELAGYIRNDLFYQHIDEIWFQEYVRLGDYQKAYSDYYPKIKDMPLGSYFHPKSVLCSIVKMEYHLHHVTRFDAQARMEKLMHLNTMLSSDFLFDDDVHSLRVFVEFCSDKDKEHISRFLVDRISNDTLRIITQTLEPTTNVAYLVALLALTTKASMSKEDHQDLNAILPIVLAYHKRAKPAILDIDLFEILYKYTKSFHQNNRSVIFLYLSSILSVIGGFNMENAKIVIDSSDVACFMECLNDEAFLAQSMYEELITYGIR